MRSEAYERTLKRDRRVRARVIQGRITLVDADPFRPLDEVDRDAVFRAGRR